MAVSRDCFYCKKDKTLKGLMIEICSLKASTLYLFRDQTYRGRCVVAYKDHIDELFELPEKELRIFMQDVTNSASAIKKSFLADKMNYGVYSDKLPHLHFHIVPKYKNTCNWGSTFEMTTPDPLFLSDGEYKKISEKISDIVLL